MSSDKKIIILGAGPTGIGAAWRLQELGHDNWLLFERSDHAGGLASSFTDARGFTWDIGGHVQFSHYDTFDRVMDLALGPEDWILHDRESWIWMRGRFIPYPLQYNIHLLPPHEMEECLRGLESLEASGTTPANFSEWVDATFGPGLRRVFMEPYNKKVWAYPLENLDAAWVGERVAVPSVERIRRNIETGEFDCSWGPNNRFRFPRRGGTGSIWRNLALRLPKEKLLFNNPAVRIDTIRRRVAFADGREEAYQGMISSISLRQFLKLAAIPGGERLVSSDSNIFGIGLKGTPPESLRTKCWIYFPEDDSPFYRVTVFSNYSPENVPGPGYWSLMAEVSESPQKPVDQSGAMAQVLEGLRATGLLRPDDTIVSTWQYRASPGYPTPFLGRDAVIDPILRDLQKLGVYSRGRFGAWKYEVSNQDHSFMQGVEAVDHWLSGAPELTLTKPDLVNTTRTR